MVSGEPTPNDDVPSRFQVDFTGRTLLGNYRVEKRLAEGGMGAVYLAQDVSLGMRVVVKVPHTRFLAEPGFRGRFRREITELVRLEHPHVVRILARGEEEEVPYFVLQFLGGGSLEDRLKSGPQTPEAVLGWLPTVAQTLDYIHARGVVHRDVKPGNVLFDDQGHVFLSDFGLVKALGRDDGGEKTEAGTGVGSPLYMAPEQAFGREVTGAADQYALASTLFEALTGEPPFGRGQMLEVLVKKQKGDPGSLRAKAPAIPEACEVAVRRALSRDPADRFPSCGAFTGAVAASFAPAGTAKGSASGPGRWALLAAGFLVAMGAVGLAAGWFRRPTAHIMPADTAKDSAGRDILMVASRGKSDQRRALRRRLKPGLSDHFEIVQTHRTTSRPDSPLKRDRADTTVQPYEVRMTARDERWVAHLEWRVPPGRLTAPPPGTPGNEAIQGMLAAPGEVRGTLGLSPRGALVDPAFSSDRPRTAEIDEAVQGVVEEVRSLEVLFPEEPLGIGAVWSVTQQTHAMGIRFSETLTFTLRSLEDDLVRVDVRSTQSVPPQTVTVPGSGFSLDVRVFEGSGEGKAVLDLGSLVPVEYELVGKSYMEATPHGADPEKATFKADTVQETKLRRP